MSITTSTETRTGDHDPGSDPAGEWDLEVSPSQDLATHMRTATASRRALTTLSGMIVYLAGPMTGVDLFNYPAFHQATRELYALGLGGVCHTADPGGAPSPEEARSWPDYLREALNVMLTHADAVVVLPGWRESKGASLEVHVALTLGMPVVEYPDLRAVESVDGVWVKATK